MAPKRDFGVNDVLRIGRDQCLLSTRTTNFIKNNFPTGRLDCTYYSGRRDSGWVKDLPTVLGQWKPMALGPRGRTAGELYEAKTRV